MLNLNWLLFMEGEQGGSVLPTILMLVAVLAIVYFLMIRPQKKQEKKDREMRDALEVGDEVTTIGGIIGKVVSIKEETFVLETTKDKTKIRFLKGAVRSVDVKASDIAASVAEQKEAKDNKDAKDEKSDKAGKDAKETKDAPAPAEEKTEEPKEN